MRGQDGNRLLNHVEYRITLNTSQQVVHLSIPEDVEMMRGPGEAGKIAPPLAASLAEAGGSLYVEGEVEVDAMDVLPERLGLSPEVDATQEALEAIGDADLVILGPGSVMTSVMPALLVGQIRDALTSTTARKVWVQNTGTEEGPMGKLSPVETHQWLRTILDFSYADAILADKSVDLGGVSLDVISASLCAENAGGKYTPEALSQAYRELLEGAHE